MEILQILLKISDYWQCFTAYAGFLRYDELSNLRISDLKFYNDYVNIFIEI